MNSGAGDVEPVEIKALEQRELLQHHRALRPGAGLAHRVAAVIIGERRLDGGVPARHVVAGEHAAMTLAAGVHDVLGAAEAIDRLGDEALRPDVARPFDLGVAAAGALGFAQHPRVSVGERLVGEQRAGRRHRAVRQVDGGRGRPMLAEQLLRPSRWWRWRARPADGLRGHRRSPARARRRAACVP